MKRITYLLIGCFLVSTILGWSQITPEQKKQMEKAQRAHDSILNSPAFKKAMQQAKAANTQLEALQKAHSNPVKRANTKQEKKKKYTGHLERYMITDSIFKKFNNWKHGQAEIYLVSIGWTSSNNIEHKVGIINADGSFSIQLPHMTIPDKEISYYFGCRVPYKGSKTVYRNPTVKIIRTYIAVKKNEKQIGILNMATSREQLGDNTMMDDYHSKPGYTLQWWYANEATSANAKCTKSKTERKEMYNTYDLNFKSGWNLVKTEFKGERFLVGDRSYFKTQIISVIPSIDKNLRWVFY